MAGPESSSNDIQTRASNKCNSMDPYRMREPITLPFRRVHYLVIKDREIECKSKTNWMC